MKNKLYDLKLMFIQTIVIAILVALFGKVLLWTININSRYAMFLIFFSILVLIWTKKSIEKINSSVINISYFLKKEAEEKVNIFYIPILVVNTLLAHITGMSVGREGVAVQLGGTIANSIIQEFSPKTVDRKFFIHLGMITGFAALFHTWLAAIFFVYEIGRNFKGIKLTWCKVLSVFSLSFFSSWLSTQLGLPKFSVKVENIEFLNFKIIFYLIIFVFCIMLLAVCFVELQKQIKLITKKKIKYVLLMFVIVVLVLSSFKYNSLGLNLINNAIYNYKEIDSWDFLLKLVLTAICTGIGFSGGEVTNLFAIGAVFGVVFASFFGLPILPFVALGYVLMFSACADLTITPIFLALEIFGFEIALLTLPFVIIKSFFNIKFSIYK